MKGSKIPKRLHACPLNDLLWQRIGEILRSRGKNFTDLWAEVKRNKNTYTNWIQKRTIPKVSDLQELAAALNVTPAQLLTPRQDGTETDEQPGQLELAFGIGRRSVQIELQYTTAGVILKTLGRAG